MLALDDQTMARVFIAATGIAPTRRKAWLHEIADRLDADQRARGRRNTRPWRKREAAGEVTLKFAIDEALVAVGLVQHGYLDPTRADDPATLSKAAKWALEELCERSPPEAAIQDMVAARFANTVRKKTDAGLQSSNSGGTPPPKGGRRSKGST